MHRQLSRGLAGALLLAACLAPGCSEGPEPEPDVLLPEGALLIARTEALARLLEGLERFEGTPLARAAAAGRAALPPCRDLEADAETLAGLLDRTRCALTRSLAPLRELRGERAMAFALPAGEGGEDQRVTGTLDWSPDGSVVIEATLPLRQPQTLLGVMLPAAEAPGPAVLSDADALVHARMRTDPAANPASAIAKHGQLASILGLRAMLFARAVLDGTWEGVVYVPHEGQTMPPVAMAVGFGRRELAVAAAEWLLDGLARAWPVHRTPFAVGDAPGACLLDLTVLPELAPCYVATQHALVFGWNPASLGRALRTAPPAARGEASSLHVELARFPEADNVLAGASGREPREYPWRALRADGRQENGRYVFRITLAAGSDP